MMLGKMIRAGFLGVRVESPILEEEGTSSTPDKASRRKLLARINADEARLIAEGRPWYEVRASLLQESDKAIIRDLSGMSARYEIMIPAADDRAHLPPEGYHTFYLNHLEMGLRFPVPRFIHNLCDHLKVSPSQLTPNSYSSLLALGVLLSLSFGFIKGNPTSHKGRMSRYFFLRRDVRDGVAWHCDMSWSVKPTRRAPPLPAQEYEPNAFLNSMSAKCFDAQDLIREDLLCHFGFSRKGIEVEEDLADRIMKAQLLEAYKKQESEATKDSIPIPEESPKEKRKRSSSGGDKRSKENSLGDKGHYGGFSYELHAGPDLGGGLSRWVTNAREVARSSR
ncbi:hypothetical protein F511_40611 [Dorcoceras hygrometricum]|uniref:Uncharacterized protein n=1 Tax=Dorcoceras hygrometricum TaxID=472368 RepID=A0A2Z7D6Q1_9LAMI|nr:hypothetical protein F511_40611 [Dorcoceras hygrometricum]